MLKVKGASSATFAEPTSFFTVVGDRRSESVISALSQRGFACHVFSSPAEAIEHSGPESVAVFDHDHGGFNRFRHVSRSCGDFPSWAPRSIWGVKVGKNCNDDHRSISCANQIYATFVKQFDDRINRGWFPWGQPKKGQSGPLAISMDPLKVREVLSRFRSGPDLCEAIAHQKFAAELPPDSRISWIRVPQEPIEFDRAVMSAATSAMRAFEQACSKFIRENSKARITVLSGVDLGGDSELAELYVNPPTSCFSVQRPDFHFTGNGNGRSLFASENDEMPGGLPELFLVDSAYGTHGSDWEAFLSWLCREGNLLFIVSNDWSKCYENETRWLVSELASKGYPVSILMSNDLDSLEITEAGVFHGGVRVGTIWRQFPVFEVRGKLKDIVVAAKRGSVRLVPEFAHYGNKVWFSLFRRNLAWFQENMLANDFAVLDGLLPDSHLVDSSDAFPCSVRGREIYSLDHLKTLPEEVRDALVLKVCGANTKAARSYGVLLGHGLKQETWSDWIDERIRLREPFLIQERLGTGVVNFPVWNTKLDTAENFRCRVLLRPWSFDGKVFSVHACAVPSKYVKIHGMVDMAVSAVELV